MAIASKLWEDPNSWSPATPLWLNPVLPEFQSIPDPALWATKGIKTIEHICIDGVLIPFNALKQKNGLPNRYFRYLQLHHAFSAQFGSQTITSLFINLIWNPNCVMISYIKLHLPFTVHFYLQSVSDWKHYMLSGRWTTQHWIQRTGKIYGNINFYSW